RLAHDLRDLLLVPTTDHLQHRDADLLHLFLVRADEHEHDLRVRALDDRPLREQSLAVEGLAEREHGALGDDRLVEVEEGCAARALVLARHGGVRLADLAGDQPAIFGLGTDPETGLADWLATGAEAPPDALDRLTIEAAPGVALIPTGAGGGPLAPVAEAEAG